MRNNCLILMMELKMLVNFFTNTLLYYLETIILNKMVTTI